MAVNYTPFIQQALQIQKAGLEKGNNRFMNSMNMISQMSKTVGDLRNQQQDMERREQQDKIAAEERKIKNQDRLRNQRIQDAALIKSNFESEMDLDIKGLDALKLNPTAYARALEKIKQKQRGFNENYQNYLMKGGDVESLIGGKSDNPFTPGSEKYKMYEGMEAARMRREMMKPKTEEQLQMESKRNDLYQQIRNLNKEIGTNGSTGVLDDIIGEDKDRAQSARKIADEDLRASTAAQYASYGEGKMGPNKTANISRLEQAVYEENGKGVPGNLASESNKSVAWRILAPLEVRDPALFNTFIQGLEDGPFDPSAMKGKWNEASVDALDIPGELKTKLKNALNDPEVRRLLRPEKREMTTGDSGFLQDLQERALRSEDQAINAEEMHKNSTALKAEKEKVRAEAIQTASKLSEGIKDLESARNYDYYNTNLGFGYDASEVGSTAENLTKRIELGYTTEKNRLERVRDAKLKTVTTEADKTEIRKQFDAHMTSLEQWRAGQLPIAQQGMKIKPAPTFDEFGLTAEDSANATESDLRSRLLPTIQGLIKEATSVEQLDEIKESLSNSAYNDNDREIAETLIDSSKAKIIENQRQLDVKSDKTIASKGFKSSEEYTAFVEGINRNKNYTSGEQKEILAEAQASFLTDRLGTQAKDRKTAEILLSEATEGASNMNADPSARVMAASQITTGLIKRINPGLTDDQAKSIAQSTRKSILSNVAQKQADAIATLGGGNTPGRDENGKPNWVASIENLNLGPDQAAIAIKKARDNRYQQNKETAKDLMKVLSDGSLSQTTRDKAKKQISELYQDDKISLDDWNQANFNADITSELGKKAEAKEIIDTKVKHNLPLSDKELNTAFEGKPELKKVFKQGYEGQMAKTHLLAAVSRGDRSAVEKWAKDNPALKEQVEKQYGITLDPDKAGNIFDQADQNNMKNALVRQKQGKEMLHSSLKHLIDPSTGKFKSDKPILEILKENNIDEKELLKNIGFSTLQSVQTVDQAKAYLEAIYSPKPLTAKQKEDQTFSRIRAAKSYYGFRWDMMTAEKRIDALNNFMTGVLPSMNMSENIQPTKYEDDISEEEVKSALEEQTGVTMPPTLTEEDMAAAPSLAPGELLGASDPSIP